MNELHIIKVSKKIAKALKTSWDVWVYYFWIDHSSLLFRNYK